MNIRTSRISLNESINWSRRSLFSWIFIIVYIIYTTTYLYYTVYDGVNDGSEKSGPVLAFMLYGAIFYGIINITMFGFIIFNIYTVFKFKNQYKTFHLILNIFFPYIISIYYYLKKA